MTNSWVIFDKKDDSIVMETYNEKLVNNLNPDRAYAVPIMEYLQNLNNEAAK